MLEQAGLEDGVTGISTRPGGKALIDFCAFAWVSKCISHFHGRKWGGNEVTALYVRVVKRAPVCAQAPKDQEIAQELSARPRDCPTSPELSATAPIFVPAAV